MSSLRERKRLRTRQALIDAAAKLFELHGYDGTTIADIAAAADISTRTFFSYFASKEDVLFPDADARVKAALTAIDERRPGERPTQILLRALGELGDAGDDLVGPMAALRLRFVRSVPSVRGRDFSVSSMRRPRSQPGCTPRFPMSWTRSSPRRWSVRS